MGKKLIHEKYIRNLNIPRNGVFVMEPGFILTPYANDLLCEMGVKIVYKDEEKEDLRCEIIKILKEDYGIDNSEIIEKILEKIRMKGCLL